ncbi:hypothetical protein ACFLZB_04040 [Nanoarchaeota archaeon]
MDNVDEYIDKVIKKGDEGSDLLETICVQTLKNSDLVDIVEGKKVLRIPEEYVVVVHSSTGDSELEDLTEYASSLVENLVEQAENIDATPIGFANIIDSPDGDLKMLETIANAFVERANHYSLAIMDGENAILGERVNCPANISGTMISIIKKEEWEFLAGGRNTLTTFGTTYAAFDPEGQPVTINSDGVGTKTEFYERIRRYERAGDDVMAMTFDDRIKDGSTVRVFSGTVETRGKIPVEKIRGHLINRAADMGVIATLDHERVEERIMGYNEKEPSYNLNASVVGTLDEEKLRNPPSPSTGDFLIAIQGKPNPRSNGITDKRRAMISMLGENYHETEVGQVFLGYLAEPSDIFYPLFRELLHTNVASSVYHMSGGAFDGKLARPLAKHNLFAKLSNLFQADGAEVAVMGELKTPNEVAYGKWPMNNPGFISTSRPDVAIKIIEGFGYQARKVGQLLEAVDGETGVRLKGILDSKGKEVYFSGKEAA